MRWGQDGIQWLRINLFCMKVTGERKRGDNRWRWHCLGVAYAIFLSTQYCIRQSILFVNIQYVAYDLGIQIMIHNGSGISEGQALFDGTKLEQYSKCSGLQLPEKTGRSRCLGIFWNYRGRDCWYNILYTSQNNWECTCLRIDGVMFNGNTVRLKHFTHAHWNHSNVSTTQEKN